MEEPSIYGALEGVASALTSTVKLLERAVNDWERREEELRDAHLDLANALTRRMNELDLKTARLDQRTTAVMRLVSDPGVCEHGVSYAPGKSDECGRSQWCGECFP